jgi:hypothetical protein
VTQEYLSVAEVAERLGIAVKTVRNRMHGGPWVRGVHWFRPQGSRPRLKWSAIEAWLQEGRPAPTSHGGTLGAAFSDDIPPARRHRR